MSFETDYVGKPRPSPYFLNNMSLRQGRFCVRLSPLILWEISARRYSPGPPIMPSPLQILLPVATQYSETINKYPIYQSVMPFSAGGSQINPCPNRSPQSLTRFGNNSTSSRNCRVSIPSSSNSSCTGSPLRK